MRPGFQTSQYLFRRSGSRITSEILRFAQNDKDEMTCLRMSLLARRLTPVVILIAQVLPSTAPQARADIPWPEVVQRLAYENDKLARRPQGHNGEYFVVCTLYYTPKESGFTFERGFDATPVTKPGLQRPKISARFSPLRQERRLRSNYYAC